MSAMSGNMFLLLLHSVLNIRSEKYSAYCGHVIAIRH